MNNSCKKVLFNIGYSQLQAEKDRFCRLDNKFNFILVFLGVIFGCYNFLYFFPKNDKYHYVYLTIFVISSIIILVDFSFVIYGMYPGHILSDINPEKLIENDVNNLTEEEIYIIYKDSYSKSATLYQNANNKKSRILKISFILTLHVVVLFVVLMIFKII